MISISAKPTMREPTHAKNLQCEMTDNTSNWNCLRGGRGRIVKGFISWCCMSMQQVSVTSKAKSDSKVISLGRKSNWLPSRRSCVHVSSIPQIVNNEIRYSRYLSIVNGYVQHSSWLTFSNCQLLWHWDVPTVQIVNQLAILRCFALGFLFTCLLRW